MLPVLHAAQLDNNNRHRTQQNQQQQRRQQQQQQQQLQQQQTQSHIHNPRQSPSQKRNANMIFRIEQLLPAMNANANVIAMATTTTPPLTATTTITTTTTTPTRSSTLGTIKRTKHTAARGNAPGGVYVSQFTPKDTHSESVASVALLPTASCEPAQLKSARAYCTQKSNGLLGMSASLLRKIKLSEDVYSYNALFELHERQVRVRIVRDIAREDEVVAWYDEELTLLMSIPFLTPLNIQGNNRYTCHMCHLTFETPHPLKIHLALGCGRSALDVLWKRLHYALRVEPASPPLALSVAQTTAAPTAHASPGHATSSTSSISPAASPQPQRAAAVALPPRLSAFKPIVAHSPAGLLPLPMHTLSSVPCTSVLPPGLGLPISLSTSTAATMTTQAANAALSYLPTISTNALPPHMSLLPPSSANPMNAAAQIEAIVSNMGASKQGHLCIYCGKVYSRKYGLKIHIRTHTGFKPLKCKFCLRPFGDPSNLNKHVRLHLQSNVASPGQQSGALTEGYQCHVCHKVLARRRDLQRHIETRHGAAERTVA